ncbi:hypothetical protein C8R44DRAFT_725668 [Mycena epipterygia]|nr:hypothetical protein C8R44DRAFT_725668 [Mycena epipterygia]
MSLFGSAPRRNHCRFGSPMMTQLTIPRTPVHTRAQSSALITALDLQGRLPQLTIDDAYNRLSLVLAGDLHDEGQDFDDHIYGHAVYAIAALPDPALIALILSLALRPVPPPWNSTRQISNFFQAGWRVFHWCRYSASSIGDGQNIIRSNMILTVLLIVEILFDDIRLDIVSG